MPSEIKYHKLELIDKPGNLYLILDQNVKFVEALIATTSVIVESSVVYIVIQHMLKMS